VRRAGATALTIGRLAAQPLRRSGDRQLRPPDHVAGSADAIEPWIAVGEDPFNVLWFSPQGTFASGVDYVFSTCKLATDSSEAMIEIAPNGDPVRTYRFSFH
jgi:hypothetical protein